MYTPAVARPQVPVAERIVSRCDPSHIPTLYKYHSFYLSDHIHDTFTWRYHDLIKVA